MKEILYGWGGLNVWLFHAVNDLHGEVIDRFMLLGTSLGGHANFSFYLALTALVAVLAVRRSPGYGSPAAERWLAVLAVFSIAYLLDGWLLGWLKPLLDFPRPPLALLAGSVHIVGQPEYHHSLPSGHSSFAMLVAASLWPVLSRGGKVLGTFFVLWVGVSRISLGAHFPADVLAGFLSSLLVVVLVRAAVKRLYGCPPVQNSVKNPSAK